MKILDKDIDAAYKLISEAVPASPLIHNQRLSKIYDCNVYLKLENTSPVGSFKYRGALYKISQLSKEQRKQGVLAVSAGNHAQGVAWAAKRYKTKSTIFMPENSPLNKVERTRSLGAKVILKGENIEECFKFAEEFNEKHKMVFVHPYQDPHVIAGQSSLGSELIEQLDHIDYVIGSIGGGGLMSGVSKAFDKAGVKTKIIGAQAAGASSMVKSLKEHKVVHSKYSATFADGIKVKKTSRSMYSLLKKFVNIPVAVDDAQIAMAVLELLEKAQVLSEGAGALPLAALKVLQKKAPKRFKGKNIVLIICGGNIDINLLGRIIDKGLIYSGRRARLKFELFDRPGELSYITGVISDEGANILQVHHDDQSPRTSLMETIVEMTIETKGQDHLDKIIKKLAKQYKRLKVLD